MQALLVARDLFGVLDLLDQPLRKTVAASDDAEAHAVFQAASHLPAEITVEQAHERRNFHHRALPVVGGKRKHRERADSQLARSIGDAPHGMGSGAMSGDTRQAALLRPTAIAVHDDGHVQAAIQL